MLRKLLKHEFRATGRIMLPVTGILLATSVAANLSLRYLLDSRAWFFSMLGILLLTAFGFAIFGVFIVSFVLMIQRFYKNLLQDEGYLMFTLPASVHQHIWSKLIVSSVWFIVTVLAIIAASLVVAYQGGFLRELLDLLRYFLEGLRKLEVSEAFNGTIYLAEFAVLMFLSLVAFSLQFYAALAAGHSQANHKLLWSVVWFFGIQFALQFAGSLLIIGSNELDVFNRLAHRGDSCGSADGHWVRNHLRRNFLRHHHILLEKAPEPGVN